MFLKVLFILFFTSLQSFAMTYSLEKTEFQAAMDIYEIAQKMSAHGFYEIDLRRQGHFLNSDFDQMYLHSIDKTKMAVLKLDLVLNSSEKVLIISEHEFVCHAQTSRGRHFALYLIADNATKFMAVCDSFLKKNNVSNLIYRLIVNEAQAGNLDNCFRSEGSQTKDFQTSIMQSSIVQGLGTCLSSALRGSVNTFSGVNDSLVALFSNPTELWKELSQQAIALKNFLTHLKDEVVLLKNTLGSLDSELILQLGCQLGGEILSSMALTALTGAGMAKLLTTFMQAVVKLKSMTSLMARLTQLKQLGQLQMAKEVLSCVATH